MKKLNLTWSQTDDGGTERAYLNFWHFTRDVQSMIVTCKPPQWASLPQSFPECIGDTAEEALALAELTYVTFMLKDRIPFKNIKLIEFDEIILSGYMLQAKTNSMDVYTRGGSDRIIHFPGRAICARIDNEQIFALYSELDSTFLTDNLADLENRDVIVVLKTDAMKAFLLKQNIDPENIEFLLNF